MVEGFQEGFREEAYELLNGLEQSLLQLEHDPENADLISAVFRSMHTLKGSAAMFGYEAISEFTHSVETMLDHVRNGRLRIDKELIDLTLAARDHIRRMLDAPDDPAISGSTDALLERVKRQVQRARGENREPVELDESVSTESIGGEETGSTTEPEAETVPVSEQGAAGALVTWHIRFVPNPDIAANGANPLLVVSELHELGDCSVHARVDSVPDLTDPELFRAHVSWDVFLTTDRGEAAIRDVFMFVEDRGELLIRLVDEIDFTQEKEPRRLGEILVDRGVVDADVVEEVLSGRHRIGDLLVGRGVKREAIDSALQEQEHVQQARARADSAPSSETIRVRSDKLDTFVDLVGELVTLQARLSRTAGGAGGAGGELSVISENFERLVSELRDHTMSIRMVQISTTFARLRRLVRDLSSELGKEVRLATHGGETELDKTVIQRLNDPLVHIIRNSIDHGIESSAEREAAGKASVGMVTISARHAGAEVEIEIADDGRGLDLDRIRRRAEELGLIGPDAQITDYDVVDLLFAPGFSTASSVTNVSGRGVGMDVVRQEVDSIGGTVTLHSDFGAGTVTTISIPLTLAIIDGLLVRVDTERFVVPLAQVEECIEYRRTAEHEEAVTNRGRLLPLIDLRGEFGIAGSRPEIEQAVVVDTAIGHVGFVVDEVVGDHQTVIKNMGRLYHNVESVGGATILGDGSVALILDVQRIASRKGNELRYA